MLPIAPTHPSRRSPHTPLGVEESDHNALALSRLARQRRGRLRTFLYGYDARSCASVPSRLFADCRFSRSARPPLRGCSDRRRRPADPDNPLLASRRIGMKDRLGLRCSCLRACGLALLSRSRHKSYYTQSRPITGTRYAGPPVTGPRRLLGLPARRLGSLSITASCVQTGCFAVTLTADPDLAFVRAVRAPARRHPSRQ